MFYNSPVKQHILDFPFEAGAVDMNLATEMTHEDIQENDIVMLYSNGYSYNVEVEQYKRCLKGALDKDSGVLTSVSRVADCQVRSAYFRSFLPDHNSPYQKMAEKAGIKHKGGKNDDVTVIVAQFSVLNGKNPRKLDGDYEYFEEDKLEYKDGKEIMEKKWKPKKYNIEKTKGDK
jgi:uncharacterized phosphosugar-binding protein